jgi:hypothetical protein
MSGTQSLLSSSYRSGDQRLFWTIDTWETQYRAVAGIAHANKKIYLFKYRGHLLHIRINCLFAQSTGYYYTVAGYISLELLRREA